MPGSHRQRVLVISQNRDLRDELVTLLSGYGFFVEYCASRLEGVKKFRAHKQPIVILDVPVLHRLPQRLFKLFRMVRKNTIVLIAAHQKEESEAMAHMRLGAYDILNLPLRTDFLKHTLNRAIDYHREHIESIFLKNAILFGGLMLPLWLTPAWVLF